MERESDPRAHGRRAACAILALAWTIGCGRIDFDPSGGAGSGSSSSLQLAYRGVRPVYIRNRAIPSLIPDVVGSPTSFVIAPGLPPGLALDPATGTIDGTPTAASPATPYTITASSASASASTTISLRTSNGFIVNSTADGTDAVPGNGLCETVDGNGVCTLRAAVMEVNAAISNIQLVYIPAQTIVLTSSLPDATRSIEVVGESAATAIVDANGVGPPINFGLNNVTMTLSYLTLRNGNGPIFNNGHPNLALVVDHALVTANAAFADLNATDTLTLTDSTFDSNTGNVLFFAGATATIDRCTFVGNTGNTSGVLYFQYGNISVTNSTFSGNAGGAGAILLNNTVAVMTHNTFAGNSATDADKGAAVTQYSSGTATWTNNLLANNVGGYGSCDMTGGPSSGGGNLVFPAEMDVTPCTFVTAIDPPAVDPRLAALADNGGPTRTMALGSGSPAIDGAVSSGCAAIDQRGVPRPQGAACDIGAYEQQ